jgi:hypothetical protein
MWQHHDTIAAMRIEELRAEAERERRWRRQDEANGRGTAAPTPGRARVVVARAVAALGRGAARMARRLDPRLAVDPGPDRLIRDA